MTEADRRALRGLVSQLVRAADGRWAGPGAPLAAGGAPREVSPALAGAVRRHLLAPLAHRAGWPGFRGDHAAATLQADRRAAVVAEAVEALARAGIRVILLKGIAYAGTLYPEPALRPMSDVDLLVSATEYQPAIDALRRTGYWHAGTHEQLSAPNHAYTLKKKDAAIDLHRHITHAGRTSIDLAEVWRRARPAAHVAGAWRAWAPHEYLIHVAHMARHELQVPAINLVDAARLRAAAHAQSTCDLEDLARQWRLARGSRAVLAVLRELAGGPARPGLLPVADTILEERRPHRIVQIVQKLALTDDLRGALALASAAARGQVEHLRRRR